MLGGYQMFYGLKIIENVWQPPIVFWIGNVRKPLATTKHFQG
jgi:hypothetical protein